ncbi:MAG: YitT family protein [Erysipelothrix sp.]|nr:YitT family protein [Erysipelothrix sp.]
MNRKLKNYIYVIGSGLIFGLSVNLLLLPLGLYNGGFTGIGQILADLIIQGFKLDPQLKITGLLTLLLNVPVFVFAYRRMSKSFITLSMAMIVTQTLTMSLIPIPTQPIVGDMFVGIILAAFIGGVGVSLAFKGRGSGGGLDIIGLYQSQQKKGSVGKIYLVVNSAIYFYCLVFYNFETAIYSIIYSMIFSYVLDKFHASNIEVSVMVFTKNKEIKQVINQQMRRGATYWEGFGSYTNSEMEVFVSIVSQEEVPTIKKIVHGLDPNAFVIITENLKVSGGFEKRLI